MSDSHNFDARFIEPDPGRGLDEAAFAPGPEQRDAPHDDLSAEIAAEIADHLAESAALARTQGHTDEEAHALAANRFGDAAAILRQCWWVKKGDTIMFRSAAIALLSICVIGLFAVAYSAWRIEASFAQQMGAISDQLAALNQNLANAPAPNAAPQHARPELSGKLYIGDPSVPAVNASVEIWNANTLEVVREVRTDEAGLYSSGPLGDGDYFLLAELVGKHNPIVDYSTGSRGNGGEQRSGRKFRIQTETVSIWPGASDIRQELDVQFRAGRVQLELPEDFKGTVGKAGLPILFDAVLKCEDLIRLAGSRTDPMPNTHWPRRGFLNDEVSGHLKDRLHNRNWNLPSANGPFQFDADWNETWIPAEEYNVDALLVPLISSSSNDDKLLTRESRSLVQKLREMLWSNLGNEKVQSLVNGFPYEARQSAWKDTQPFTFEVRPNQLTRLRLVVPDGYEDGLNAALAREPWDNAEIIEKFSPVALKIELIGYEPLEEGK